MGDPSATKDKAAAARGLNSEARGTTAKSRGLDAALAGQSRRRRQQPLLDRDALAEEMRRSREQADRVQQREAEAARRRRPPDDVRIELASRDPFGALEVGAENVIVPSPGDTGPELAGIPVPPFGEVDKDLQKALADIMRRQQENPPKDRRLRNVIQLGDLFNAIPQQARERILAALRAPRPLPKVKPPQEFSLQEGVRLLGRTKIGALRQAGAKIHSKYGNDLPLNHKELNTVIYYVGPGVGVMFTPTGDMVEFPFGTAFDVEAVHEWAKPNGGIFFSVSMRETVRLYSEVEYREGIFRVKTGGPLREWLEVDKYVRNRAILFIVSPSYFQRRGFGSALAGLPDRAWQAASLAIENDYLLYAAGDQAKKIQNMGASDIAKTIVELAIDVLSPFPSYEDLEDMKRLGRANIMAMWGASGPHINSDLDIAARLYAREAAAQILGIGFKAAKRVAKKVSGSLGKGGDPNQADIETRDPTTTDSPQASVRPTQPDQPPAAIGDGGGARRAESELSPEAEARAARLGEEEPGQGINRRPDSQTPTSGRATVDPVQPSDRQIDDTNTNNPDRSRSETPAPNARPRPLTDLRQRIGDDAMDELEAKARSDLESFRDANTRDGAIHKVKGLVQESFIPELPVVRSELARARRVAEQAGVDPSTIRLVSNVWDDVRDNVGRGGRGELSDGLIVGVRSWEITPEGTRVPKEIVVFGIVESKAKGSRSKLHTEDKTWGQFDRSRARLESEGAPTEIEGRTYIAFDGSPRDARAGRVDPDGPTLYTSTDFGIRMRFIGVLPGGLSDKVKQNMRNKFTEEAGQKRDFVLTETPYTDADHFDIAEALLESLDPEP